MQRITTKEPSDDQLAIAICAIKASMEDEFPNFDPSEYAIPVEENLKHIAFTGLNEKEKNALMEKINKRLEEEKNKDLEDAPVEDTLDDSVIDENSLEDLKKLDGVDNDDI
jgi:hypothetical protein